MIRNQTQTRPNQRTKQTTMLHREEPSAGCLSLPNPNSTHTQIFESSRPPTKRGCARARALARVVMPSWSISDPHLAGGMARPLPRASCREVLPPLLLLHAVWDTGPCRLGGWPITLLLPPPRCLPAPLRIHVLRPPCLLNCGVVAAPLLSLSRLLLYVCPDDSAFSLTLCV
jgi:hypothetical protein